MEESIVGQVYTRLTVMREVAPRLYVDGRGYTHKQRRVLCRCECGTEKVVALNHLRAGIRDPRKGTKSCGCLARETAAKLLIGKTGAQNPAWKGGLSRHVRKNGYVALMISPTHPLAAANHPLRPMLNPLGNDGRLWVAEHRFVMAEHKGRPLERHETVHHKNGLKGDNHIANLELHVGNHGKGATHRHCCSCTCFD